MSYTTLHKKLPILLLAAAVFTATGAKGRTPTPLAVPEKASSKFASALWNASVPIFFSCCIGLIGYCLYEMTDSRVDRRLGYKHVSAAQVKDYLNEYVHYLDREGNARVGIVVSVFDDAGGKSFLLIDGNEIAEDQLRGINRGGFGWGAMDTNDTIFFSTKHAEALNDEARAFVADGRHRIIKASVDEFFSSYFIRATYDLSRDGWQPEDAEFLIHRDKITHHLD